MAYDLDSRLVIGVASSAIFDLEESDAVFEREGEESYRIFQEKNLEIPLPKGIAFSFVKRLLSLNALRPDPKNPLVEVVLLSKNDPDTGLRVMNTIKHYDLKISRAIFMQGHAPYEFIPALNIALFLSGNSADVEKAIFAGYPAGHVLNSAVVDDDDDEALRIAFDFDGVLADDTAEAIYQNTKDVNKFHEHEVKNVTQPHNPGPLQKFLIYIRDIQKLEENAKLDNKAYKNKLRVSIVTARNAPSHERALKTLKSWGVLPNDAFFLGGIEKSKVLGLLRPHIFFDDQEIHLETARSVVPSVHIPFGVINQQKIEVDSPPVAS